MLAGVQLIVPKVEFDTNAILFLGGYYPLCLLIAALCLVWY
jgi:hypothetical protein